MQGASTGMILSLVVTTTLAIGSFTIEKQHEYLPISVEECKNTTFSPWITKPHSIWPLQHSNPVEIGWTSDGDVAYPMSIPHELPER